MIEGHDNNGFGFWLQLYFSWQFIFPIHASEFEAIHERQGGFVSTGQLNFGLMSSNMGNITTKESIT